MFNSKHQIVSKNNKLVSSINTNRSPTLGANLGRKETAGVSGGGSTSVSTAGNQGKNLDLMLTSLIPTENETQLRKFYMDLYTYDSVAGAACDLTSVMPFSDFTLTGLDNKKIEKYEQSIERLSIRNMLPEISLDYLVNGVYCSSLLFDAQSKSFLDSLPYSPGQIEAQYTPFYSRDPLITVRPDSDMKKFASSNEPYMVKLRSQMPDNLIAAFKSGGFTPDPLTTIYMPRRVFTHQTHGTSYLKRLLPVYLLEKTMYRSTLVEANRRIRSMLHIPMGDENWEPTAEEYAAVTAMFQQADLDPLGAVIATRNSVAPSELRQGGDFWKYTDVLGDTTSIKLRALGLSEAFLSGDSNFATQETALSTFMETLKAYRQMVTQKLFYNKMFPVIAVSNGYFKNGVDKNKYKDLGFATNDSANLEIPEIRWHKSLQATNDRDTFDMLEKLTEKGIPVPLRMWAAAGNLELESLISGWKQDEKDLELIKQYAGKQAKPEDEEAGFDLVQVASGRKFKAPKSLLSRDFGEDSEIVAHTVTGKKKYVHNQVAANKKFNDDIMKAVRNMKDPQYYARVAKETKDRLRIYGVN